MSLFAYYGTMVLWYYTTMVLHGLQVCLIDFRFIYSVVNLRFDNFFSFVVNLRFDMVNLFSTFDSTVRRDTSHFGGDVTGE